jgi:hypothetical protein
MSDPGWAMLGDPSRLPRWLSRAEHRITTVVADPHDALKLVVDRQVSGLYVVNLGDLHGVVEQLDPPGTVRPRRTDPSERPQVRPRRLYPDEDQQRPRRD